MFYVYIDAAGDPGVKPKSNNEPVTTDWCVLSAVVVSATREPDVVDWVTDMEVRTGKTLAPAKRGPLGLSVISCVGGRLNIVPPWL